MLKLFSWISKFFNPIKGTMSKLFVGLSLVSTIGLVILSVILGFWIPTKLLGLPIAAFGCFVAGCIFSFFLSRFLRQNADASAREKDARCQELAEEKKRLLEENKRLKRQRIDINAFQRVLKLGLAEADMRIWDVKKEWIDDLDLPMLGFLGNTTRSQYVGVLEQTFKGVFGVDLSKVRIFDDGSELHIAGITPENIGYKDYRKTWHLCQIQNYAMNEVSEMNECREGFEKDGKVYEIDRTNTGSICMDLNKTEAYSTAQVTELENRINNGAGQEFRIMKEYIHNMAKCFITVLLNPIGKPLNFIETPVSELENDEKWSLILEFSNNYNNQLTVGNADCH